VDDCYSLALLVQDASNINGVAKDLPKVMELARQDLRERQGEYSTVDVAHHPAVRLYMSKLADMAAVGIMDIDAYSELTRICTERAKTKWHVYTN
jgi:hypothetical protein